MVTTWGCYDCDDGDSGPDMGRLTAAAERHTKGTGHPTWCTTNPTGRIPAAVRRDA